jgi:hypothetical protein
MEHLKLYEEFIFINQEKEKQKSIDKTKDEISYYEKGNSPMNVSINGDNLEEAKLKINGTLQFEPQIILSIKFPEGYDDYLNIINDLNLETVTRDGVLIGVDDMSIHGKPIGHIYVRRKKD